MKTQSYWIRLKVAHPELYAQMDRASRRQHVVRRRTRATNWNKRNRDQRNQRRRERYAQNKVTQQGTHNKVQQHAHKVTQDHARKETPTQKVTP